MVYLATLFRYIYITSGPILLSSRHSSQRNLCHTEAFAIHKMVYFYRLVGG